MSAEFQQPLLTSQTPQPARDGRTPDLPHLPELPHLLHRLLDLAAERDLDAPARCRVAAGGDDSPRRRSGRQGRSRSRGEGG